MTAGGLSVLDNAPLHFLSRFPSTSTTSDDTDTTTTTNGNSSSSSSGISTGGDNTSDACGSAVTILLEGIRPQPVEIQALCSLKDRQNDEPSLPSLPSLPSSPSSSSSPAAAGVEVEVVDGGFDDESSDGVYDSESAGEAETAANSDWEEEGAGRGGAEDGGAPFYAFKNAIGLKDRQRLSMLTTILSEHSAIKVRRVSPKP
jgi:hypothetical protein